MLSQVDLQSAVEEIRRFDADWAVPLNLSRNFAALDADRLSAIQNQFIALDASLALEGRRGDLLNELYRRLSWDRIEVVPWLASVRPLAGLRILEIGCGPGSSTAALAEQGARITAVDMQAHCLRMAQARCATMGIGPVDFHEACVADIGSMFAAGQFDVVIFFASLEHMLVAERLDALATAWGMLTDKGLLVVVDAPNRLWVIDDHTTYMPFMHWLPDDLALAYTRKFCGRKAIVDQVQDEKGMLSFQRAGRGVSFHEFELALGRDVLGKVISSKQKFLRSVYPIHQSQWEASDARVHAGLLMKHAPGVHEGFFDPYVDVVIEK